VGHIVSVLGEAGLGKSRLISESYRDFAELIGEQGNWYETLSLSYESGQAYGLFKRLVRRIASINYDDPEPQVRQKLAALLAVLPPERRPLANQLLEKLYGLETENGELVLEGESFKLDLLETMQAIWQELFANRPTVMVFDDMHWSDAASIDLLLQLLPLIEEVPLVMLSAMRSERHMPAWQMKTTADQEFHHRHTELFLHPLSEAESGELLDRLLNHAKLPERLRANILEKSAGNPFFIEEVVRTLIDSGVVVPEERYVNGDLQRSWRATSQEVDFAIPDNLQSLLAARLDRLEEATRSTLQVASVIGRSFPHRVLQAVDESSPELDRRLETLLRLEMIREAARVPELEYSFRNPLTQEAVYQTILIKRRREFHRRVAEAMEALYPDRLEAFSGLLAHHYLLAGERDRAIEYSRQAASQAIKLFAYEEAVQNLKAALDLIKAGENSPIQLELLEELGDVYHLLLDGHQAINHYQQALALWRALGEPGVETTVRLNRKIVQAVIDLKWLVDLEHLQPANESRLKSLADLKKSLQIMESEPPHPETALACVALATDAWRIQEPPDWDAAQYYARKAVEMAGQLPNPVDLSKALGALANILEGRSLLREHLQVAERRLQIARQPGFGDVFENIDALRNAGAGYMYVGEYQQALPLLQEAEALAERAHIVDQQMTATGLQAQCLFRMDRWDEVLSTEDRWRDLERRYRRERVGGT
jgi:tetratricopeptide (TPR) repeat protein